MFVIATQKREPELWRRRAVVRSRSRCARASQSDHLLACPRASIREDATAWREVAEEAPFLSKANTRPLFLSQEGPRRCAKKKPATRGSGRPERSRVGLPPGGVPRRPKRSLVYGSGRRMAVADWIKLLTELDRHVLVKAFRWRKRPVDEARGIKKTCVRVKGPCGISNQIADVGDVGGPHPVSMLKQVLRHVTSCSFSPRRA